MAAIAPRTFTSMAEVRAQFDQCVQWNNNMNDFMNVSIHSILPSKITG